MQEFDIIEANTLSVRGNFIEYTAIQQSEAAIRSGNAEIEVRADNVLVGRLLPGEVIRLEKAATQWTITAKNYARVRIGMGTADFVGSRGINYSEVANRTVRGTEFALSVRTTINDLGFLYTGILNTSTDKAISLYNMAIYTTDTTDCVFTIASIVSPVLTNIPLMSKHSDYVGDSTWMKSIVGKTTAFIPTAGEMTVHQEMTVYNAVIGLRNGGATDAGAPFIIGPGKAFLGRSTLTDKPLVVRANLGIMTYGPR